MVKSNFDPDTYYGNLGPQAKRNIRKKIIRMRDKGKIPLPKGWHLIRCEDEKSPHHKSWFLSTPETEMNIWVAKFWDGPAAGERDALYFAYAVYHVYPKP